MSLFFTGVFRPLMFMIIDMFGLCLTFVFLRSIFFCAAFVSSLAFCLFFLSPLFLLYWIVKMLYSFSFAG